MAEITPSTAPDSREKELLSVQTEIKGQLEDLKSKIDAKTLSPEVLKSAKYKRALREFQSLYHEAQSGDDEDISAAFEEAMTLIARKLCDRNAPEAEVNEKKQEILSWMEVGKVVEYTPEERAALLNAPVTEKTSETGFSSSDKERIEKEIELFRAEAKQKLIQKLKGLQDQCGDTYRTIFEETVKKTAESLLPGKFKEKEEDAVKEVLSWLKEAKKGEEKKTPTIYEANEATVLEAQKEIEALNIPPRLERREPGFREALKEVCDVLTEENKKKGGGDVKPENLVKIMQKESWLDPQARNKDSGATGLIQFMPSTARELGTSVGELFRMGATDQLRYVQDYFLRKIKALGPLDTVGELYMAVFYPLAINKPNEWKVGSQEGSAMVRKIARQNPGITVGDHDYITRQDIVNFVEGKITEPPPERKKSSPTKYQPSRRMNDDVYVMDPRNTDKMVDELGARIEAVRDTRESIANYRREKFLERLKLFGATDIGKLITFPKAKITFLPVDRTGGVDWYGTEKQFLNSEYQYEAEYKGKKITLVIPTNKETYIKSEIGGKEDVSNPEEVEIWLKKNKETIKTKVSEEKDAAEKAAEEKEKENELLEEISEKLWEMMEEKETSLEDIYKKAVESTFGSSDRTRFSWFEKEVAFFTWESREDSEKKEIDVITSVTVNLFNDEGRKIKFLTKGERQEVKGEYFSSDDSKVSERITKNFNPEEGKLPSEIVEYFFPNEGPKSKETKEFFSPNRKTKKLSLQKYHSNGQIKTNNNEEFNSDGKLISGKKVSRFADGTRKEEEVWDKDKEEWVKTQLLANTSELEALQVPRRLVNNLKNYDIRETKIVSRAVTGFIFPDNVSVPILNSAGEEVGSVTPPDDFLKVTYEDDGKVETSEYAIVYDHKLYRYNEKTRKFNQSHWWKIDEATGKFSFQNSYDDKNNTERATSIAHRDLLTRKPEVFLENVPTNPDVPKVPDGADKPLVFVCEAETREGETVQIEIFNFKASADAPDDEKWKRKVMEKIDGKYTYKISTLGDAFKEGYVSGETGGVRFRVFVENLKTKERSQAADKEIRIAPKLLREMKDDTTPELEALELDKKGGYFSKFEGKSNFETNQGKWDEKLATELKKILSETGAGALIAAMGTDKDNFLKVADGKITAIYSPTLKAIPPDFMGEKVELLAAKLETPLRLDYFVSLELKTLGVWEKGGKYKDTPIADYPVGDEKIGEDNKDQFEYVSGAIRKSSTETGPGGTEAPAEVPNGLSIDIPADITNGHLVFHWDAKLAEKGTVKLEVWNEKKGEKGGYSSWKLKPEDIKNGTRSSTDSLKDDFDKYGVVSKEGTVRFQVRVVNGEGKELSVTKTERPVDPALWSRLKGEVISSNPVSPEIPLEVPTNLGIKWPDSVEGFPTFTWVATVPAGGHIELRVPDADGYPEWEAAREATGSYPSSESIRTLWEQSSISEGKLKFKVAVVEGTRKSEFEQTVPVTEKLMRELKGEPEPEQNRSLVDSWTDNRNFKISGSDLLSESGLMKVFGGPIDKLKTALIEEPGAGDLLDSMAKIGSYQELIVANGRIVGLHTGVKKFPDSFRSGTLTKLWADELTTPLKLNWFPNLQKAGRNTIIGYEVDGVTITNENKGDFAYFGGEIRNISDTITDFHESNGDWFKSWIDNKNFTVSRSNFLSASGSAEALKMTLIEEPWAAELLDGMAKVDSYQELTVENGRIVKLSTSVKEFPDSFRSETLTELWAENLTTPLKLDHFPNLQEAGWVKNIIGYKVDDVTITNENKGNFVYYENGILNPDVLVIEKLHNDHKDWFRSENGWEDRDNFSTNPGSWSPELRQAVEKTVKGEEGAKELFDSMGDTNEGQWVKIENREIKQLCTFGEEIPEGFQGGDLWTLRALNLKTPLNLARFPRLEHVFFGKWRLINNVIGGAEKSDYEYIGGKIQKVGGGEIEYGNPMQELFKTTLDTENTEQLDDLLILETEKKLQMEIVPEKLQWGKSTILEYAAQEGKTEIVRHLLSTYRMDIPLGVVQGAYDQLAERTLGNLTPKRTEIRKMLEKAIEDRKPSKVKQIEDLPPLQR